MYAAVRLSKRRLVWFLSNAPPPLSNPQHGLTVWSYMGKEPFSLSTSIGPSICETGRITLSKRPLYSSVICGVFPDQKKLVFSSDCLMTALSRMMMSQCPTLEGVLHFS